MYTRQLKIQRNRKRLGHTEAQRKVRVILPFFLPLLLVSAKAEKEEEEDDR